MVRRPRTLLLLLLFACGGGAAAAGAEAAEEREEWYDAHIERVAVWAAEACVHILSERVRTQSEGGAAGSEPCASFVSEHGSEFLEARKKAIGADARAAELCGEVAHILQRVGDDEVVHLASKMPLKRFCAEQFSIDADAGDFFAQLKHFFVLNERKPHEEL